MGTISSAFSIISGALEADQSGLSIIGGNVANANTPGYTREIPQWQENAPVEISGKTYGTGVTETGAESLRDRILEERLDQQQQLASASSARLSALNSLQAIFSPDSGSSGSTAGDIGADITSFFKALSGLQTDASDDSEEQTVISAANTLAGDISNAANSLNSQRAAVDQEAAGTVPEINALTSSIAQLNKEIESQSPNSDAGVLEDQRQQDLSQLSQLIGINQITTQDNGLTITTTSGQVLVAMDQSNAITTAPQNGVTQFYVGTTNITQQLATGGGSLGGYVMARDQDIPNALTQLDQLAYGISTEVNAQNAQGFVFPSGSTTGSAGGNIFSQPTTVTGSALSMSVVATASGIAASGVQGESGDNSNALALGNLGSKTGQIISEDPPYGDGVGTDPSPLISGVLLNNDTPTNFFSSFVTKLGSTVSEVNTENTAENASVSQLTTQNNSFSEVNLNDEASAMTTLERSYQAASEVFGILNTVMSSALNLGTETTV